jgi:peptidoglycan/xylan/chitin deacetylase (PgdA/CDA1 family)
VLCYHGLKRDDDVVEDWLLVSESCFVRQMAYIAARFRCISLEQGMAELSGGSLPRASVCVTFDDGYRSNLSLALPILETFGIPATIYLATGFIGTARSLWTSRLLHGLSSGPPRSVTLEHFGLPALYFGKGRHARVHSFLEALKLLPAAQRRSVVMHLDALAGGDIHVPEAFSFLDWDEVRTLAAHPLITIGAHTVDHEILSTLPDKDILPQISGSRDDVSAALGATPATFAYPNGRAIDYDDRAVAALRMTGFTSAVTTIRGLNVNGVDPLEVRRVLVGGGDSFDTFRLSLSGMAAQDTPRHTGDSL